eukprot:gb/GEZN01012058.1/.p1 GENE.gb/GEZN01012058.1/~~gb/GEZN01012058.1/.p1  ORF type:complete len:207 (+),score=19.64 gb/GEZN01012058.1/:68-688(+)
MMAWVLIASLVAIVQGYPTGAPICSTTDLSVITDMTSRRRTGNNGWAVTSSAATYTAGGTVTLTISGGPSGAILKGFTLQANSGSTSGAGVGQFATPSGTKHGVSGSCKNKAYFLTHSTTRSSTSLEVVWTAPVDATSSVVFSAIAYDSSGPGTFSVATASTVTGDGSHISPSPGSPSAGVQLAANFISVLALLLPVGAMIKVQVP